MISKAPCTLAVAGVKKAKGHLKFIHSMILLNRLQLVRDKPLNVSFGETHTI